MIIAKALIGRVSYALAVLALGFGAGMAKGQTDGADAPAIKFATLHSFTGPDGRAPVAALVQATNGELYGTTPAGGANCATGADCGTIFKMTPEGAFASVYSFCAQTNCTDGQDPRAD